MVKTFSAEFVAWLESLGFDDSSEFSDAQVAKLQAEFNAKQAKLTSDLPRTLDEVLTARKAEETRQSKIAALVDDSLASYPGRASEIEAIARLAAADPTWTTNRFELELLRAMRPQSGQFRPSSGRGNPDSRVVEAALAVASGLPNLEKHYAAETLDAVDRTGLRNIGIGQALLMSAAANGMVLRAGERIGNHNVREALEYAFPHVTARLSGFSTISLPDILSSLATKQALEAFKDSDQTWRLIAAIKSNRDFKAATDHRLHGDTGLKPLGKGGEIEHGTLGESKFSRTLATKARMLSITRQDLTNDDLQVIQDLREILSRGAARSFNLDFWTAFLANSDFFKTANANYISGATSTLLADGVGLQLGIDAFDKLKGPDGTRIGGNATLLLHPPEVNGAAARRLYVSQNLVGGSTALPDKNIYEGQYQPIKQPLLSDSTIPGYSPAAWYLLRAVGELAAMAVTFLNGQQSPVYETAQADFNHDGGIQSKAVWDYDCSLYQQLAGIKSKGAA